VGFATPGYQNSQFLEGITGNNEINLSSSTLSPDNDGFEDALTILYHWQTPGWIANVRFLTEQGQLVRNLIKNQTLGTEGAWVWDGLNEQAERVPIGIYILKIQVFNASGQVKNYTKTCVVATKLN
jgi:flagellar hook assembly protein FlgD